MPDLNDDLGLLDKIMDEEAIAADYFGQDEYYFSESQGQLIRIKEMIPKYALNCWRKLWREHRKEFPGSPLSHALLDHISPSQRVLSDVLRQHGKAVVFCGTGGASVAAARQRLRRAGAASTHHDGEFVEGRVPEVHVNVRTHA